MLKRGVQVVDAPARSSPRPRSIFAGALEEVLEPGAGRSSNRSKIWSSSTAVAVWSGADHAAVLDLVAVRRAELQVDVAVGDARQRRLLDHHLGAAAQRLVVAVVDPQSTSAWPSWVTSMSLTLPTLTPPALTWLPLTSWPALMNSAVTVQPPSRGTAGPRLRRLPGGPRRPLAPPPEIRTVLLAQPGPTCAH